MNIELIEITDARWDKFLEDAPHDFYHLPRFAALAARTTEKGHPMAVLVEEGEAGFLLPFIRRDVPSDMGLHDAISPYGYPSPVIRGCSAHNSEFVRRATSALQDEFKNRRYVSLFVRMHPVLDGDLDGFAVGELITHGETVVIDLYLDEEQQWRQHQAGHRNEINRSLRAGHEVFLDHEWRYFDDFIRLYTETMRRVGARSYYIFDEQYFRGFRDALGPSIVKLGVIRVGGTVAAAGLFTAVSGVVQYHLSGSDPAFAREQPTKLLLHHVRQWATRAGHHWFHLGGGVGAGEDALFRFKAGFSKLRRSFRTWRVVPDGDLYSAVVKRTSPEVNPADRTGYFPAYRQP